MDPSHGHEDEWPRLRPALPSWEGLRSALWFWPAVAATSAFALALWMASTRPAEGSFALWAWPGDHSSATAFLQVVAGSVITVTSLTFTLVVVALQLASQQFSPRLLREFVRDLFTQVVLAILVSTFVVAVTVLRAIDTGEPLPRLGLAVAFVMVLMSVSALLGFLGHIARLVRVDTMMAAVHRETRETMDDHYRPYRHQDEEPDLPPAARDGTGVLVGATGSGFVQRLDIRRLVAAADQHDAFVVVGIRPGDHVTTGSPLARLHVAPERCEALADAVRRGIGIGYERTLEQDAALGMRQLTDIAVKALSPGINDPTTAVHALGHLGDLLVRLQSKRLGDVVHASAVGTPRVQAPDRDLRYYLDLVMGPVRRYGAHETTVLLALHRVLRDLAAVARDDGQRAEIARQARLVTATMPDDLLADDAEPVRDGERRVHEALRGALAAAYTDRAGETRST